jgi:hypothetical protein
MMSVFRRSHDPFWDMEGRGAKRTRIRVKLVSDLAFAVAIVACGLTAAAWIRVLAPVLLQKLGLA